MELFKGDVSGGEAGTGFPRMVLLFLSGTMGGSSARPLDRTTGAAFPHPGKRSSFGFCFLVFDFFPP
jgi:hypothetical protein